MSRSDDEQDALMQRQAEQVRKSIAKKYPDGITFTPRTPVSRPPQTYSSPATLPHYKLASTPIRGVPPAYTLTPPVPPTFHHAETTPQQLVQDPGFPDALEDYIQLGLDDPPFEPLWK
ncbi:hypothetical protein BT69DRAFT_1355664 [Atractiella rhizophila]|nr:hypothetical protein BT69DRAFT_1355664 [Atractiella rhizophila]